MWRVNRVTKKLMTRCKRCGRAAAKAEKARRQRIKKALVAEQLTKSAVVALDN